MAERSRNLGLPVGVLVAVVVAILTLRTHDAVPALHSSGRTIGDVSASERAASFAFAPGTSDYDREAILTAVSHASPDARRLIGIVDGLVDLSVGVPGGRAVGVTSTAGKRFSVVLNLGAAARVNGQRGIDRLVLHELGHVVRFALVRPQLRDRLVAQVPHGYGCDDGVRGACAQPEEIFAESFAKWATGDIGVNLYLGYAVPPPPDLQAWGAPLAALK